MKKERSIEREKQIRIEMEKQRRIKMVKRGVNRIKKGKKV